MPYVNVYIEADEALSEVSEEELREELRIRMTRNGKGHRADFQIPEEEARLTLQKAADYFRKLGWNAIAFKLEEIIEDYVGIPQLKRPRLKNGLMEFPKQTTKG